MKHISIKLLAVFFHVLFITNCSLDLEQNQDLKDRNLTEYNRNALNYLLSDGLLVSTDKFSDFIKKYESIKIILKFDSEAKVFALKKDSQNVWNLKSLKFSRFQTPADLITPIPNQPVKYYVLLAKNNVGYFDVYWRNNNGIAADKGISTENFEAYMKGTTEYLKEFFPDGYTKQLDEKGGFITE